MTRRAREQEQAMAACGMNNPNYFAKNGGVGRVALEDFSLATRLRQTQKRTSLGKYYIFV